MKQRNLFAAFSCILFIFSHLYSQPPKTASDSKIIVDLNSPGAKIPSSMYGIFFEEINHSGDGGLYGANLVENDGRSMSDG